MSKRKSTAPRFFAGALTETQLVHLLERRHPPAEYAFFSQVPTGTGFRREVRFADAVVLSLWPSRGLVLTGFEIKSHRGDWVRERANPAKADAIAQFCDYWYVVAPNPSVVPVAELPETWGLLLPDAKAEALLCVKSGTKLEAQPLTRSFIAGLLRRASEAMVPAKTLEQKVRAARAAGKAEAEHVDPASAELDRLRKLEARVGEFEQASGISFRFSHDSVAKVGAMCRLLLQLQQQVSWSRSSANRRLQEFRCALDLFRRSDLVKALDTELAQIERLAKNLETLRIEDAVAPATTEESGAI